MDELKVSRNKTTEARGEESNENNETEVTARAGLDAVNMAITIMSKFYMTVAKETVDLTLAQQGPADDAPDAGFKNGQAYTGAQGAAEGIVGLMNVMKSDFERTISETLEAEDQAQQEYLEFMTVTGKS